MRQEPDDEECSGNALEDAKCNRIGGSRFQIQALEAREDPRSLAQFLHTGIEEHGSDGDTKDKRCDEAESKQVGESIEHEFSIATKREKRKAKAHGKP